MKIFLICKVRGATLEEIEKQKGYVEFLENQGHTVHWPHRDTNQKDITHGTEICRTTFWAIFKADEVHILFDPTSQGFVADMMMVFALKELYCEGVIGRRRKVVIVNPDAVQQKIQEEMSEQSATGVEPRFAKSYTMVLWNLAQETEGL